jgi:hypothetical protein
MFYFICLLKRRILFILMVFLVLAPIISLAQDRGGKRRDYQFSSWKELEESVLSELRQIQKLKQDLRELRKIYESAVDKYHSAETGGFLGLFDPKKKARKDMDNAHEKLKRAERRLLSSEEKIKDFLTSTPPGNRLRNLMNFKANTEAIELRNALLSVQGIVESLGMMLETDKSDSITAVEYYQNYLEMLGYLQTMHMSFIERAEGEYYEHLKNLWGEWLKHSADIKREAAKISVSETRVMLNRKLEDTSRVVSQMPHIVRGLATMKNWAQNNLTKIREKKTAVNFLQDHAILAQNTEEIVSDIDTAFLTLKFEDPPLVEFEIDIEQIKLRNVSSAPQKG